MREMRRLLTISLVLISCTGCHPGGPERVRLTPSTVLLLPTRNAVHNGKPHPEGADSGAYFTHSLQDQLVEQGWRVVLTTDARFTNTSIAPAEEAIAEARRLDAEYVLRTVLGEFRDMAPMTPFLRDLATVEAANLWQTRNGALVWSLRGPIDSSGMNVRHYYHLLDSLAEQTAGIITKAKVERELIDGPPRPVIDPLGSITGSTTSQCTTDQILRMKAAGLSDEQVRRACEQGYQDH